MNNMTYNRKALMTHIVLGYPSLEENLKIIKIMSDAGVDYIELQIPFTDPIADGPTILNANQSALKNNISVTRCMEFAEKAVQRYKNMNYLFMTYFNIVFNIGVEKFIHTAKKIKMYGIITPDIPFDEDKEGYYAECKKNDINPIYVFSPTTGTERLKKIKEFASGFVYCTSRIGITGAGKNPHEALAKYISTVKKIIDIPVAVGFGINTPEKAKAISQFADIIIIGSRIIDIINEPGKYEKKLYKFLIDVKRNI